MNKQLTIVFARQNNFAVFDGTKVLIAEGTYKGTSRKTGSVPITEIFKRNFTHHKLVKWFHLNVNNLDNNTKG